MENKSKNINIELRSEEVQELMGRIPPVILRVGIGSILLILLLFFVASFHIKYPTYETVPVKLNIGENTCDVVMPFDGIIVNLNVDDGESIKMHDTLMQVVNPIPSGNDITVLRSPSDGIVYACDFLERDVFQAGNASVCYSSGLQRKNDGKMLYRPTNQTENGDRHRDRMRWPRSCVKWKNRKGGEGDESPTKRVCCRNCF